MPVSVTLRPTDGNNFPDAFHLKPKPEQETFVSHPVRSLAQAYIHRNECTPFGICDGDEIELAMPL